MVKIVYKGIAYYMQDEQVSPAMSDFNRPPHIQSIKLTQHSDFVVDTVKNELVKCRYDLETVVDAAMKTLYN